MYLDEEDGDLLIQEVVAIARSALEHAWWKEFNQHGHLQDMDLEDEIHEDLAGIADQLIDALNIALIRLILILE